MQSNTVFEIKEINMDLPVEENGNIVSSDNSNAMINPVNSYEL